MSARSQPIHPFDGPIPREGLIYRPLMRHCNRKRLKQFWTSVRALLSRYPWQFVRQFGDMMTKIPLLCMTASLSCCLDLRCAGSPDLRRFMEPSLRDAERRVQSELWLLGQHHWWNRYPSESGEVQRICGAVAERSRFRDRSRQVRVRLRSTLWQFRRRQVERLLGRCTLFRVLDRSAELTMDLAPSFKSRKGCSRRDTTGRFRSLEWSDWNAPIQSRRLRGLRDRQICGMLEAGVPKDDVSIVVLKNFFPNEYHAVAAARVNGEWLILDNRTPTLVRDTDVTRTIPVFEIDAEGVRRFVRASRIRRAASWFIRTILRQTCGSRVANPFVSLSSIISIGRLRLVWSFGANVVGTARSGSSVNLSSSIRTFATSKLLARSAARTQSWTTLWPVILELSPGVPSLKLRASGRGSSTQASAE